MSRHPNIDPMDARPGEGALRRPMTRRDALRALAAGCAAALMGNVLTGQTQEMELEYQLKAAFLFNFLKFTQWPKNKFVPATPSMVVGCLADDPAAPYLARALREKTINGLPIQLTQFEDLTDLDKCHVIFLSRARKPKIDEVIARLKQVPVLTVSEVDQFGQRGGIINFVRQDRTFRFEINLEAAEGAKLKISSDLASMATVVKTQPSK